MALNVVAITGNLTRDPEIRSTAGGEAVAHFSVAVNDRSRNRQTGEWEDRPSFIDCTCFGNRAEWAGRELRRGQRVAVSGRLRQSSWEGRDGQRRSKVEVVANEVVPMQRARREEGPAEVADAYETEDIPF